MSDQHFRNSWSLRISRFPFPFSKFSEKIFLHNHYLNAGIFLLQSKVDYSPSLSRGCLLQFFFLFSTFRLLYVFFLQKWMKFMGGRGRVKLLIDFLWSMKWNEKRWLIFFLPPKWFFSRYIFFVFSATIAFFFSITKLFLSTLSIPHGGSEICYTQLIPPQSQRSKKHACDNVKHFKFIFCFQCFTHSLLTFHLRDRAKRQESQVFVSLPVFFFEPSI